MNYSEIDKIIMPWASIHSLKWMESFNGEERRFLYKSNNLGECYQISIDPPEIEIIKVNLYSVERYEKDDVHYFWNVKISEIIPALDAAISKISELEIS